MENESLTSRVYFSEHIAAQACHNTVLPPAIITNATTRSSAVENVAAHIGPDTGALPRETPAIDVHAQPKHLNRSRSSVIVQHTTWRSTARSNGYL